MEPPPRDEFGNAQAASIFGHRLSPTLGIVGAINPAPAADRKGIDEFRVV
jgi:hypothetical protein